MVKVKPWQEGGLSPLSSGDDQTPGSKNVTSSLQLIDMNESELQHGFLCE